MQEPHGLAGGGVGSGNEKIDKLLSANEVGALTFRTLCPNYNKLQERLNPLLLAGPCVDVPPTTANSAGQHKRGGAGECDCTLC